MSFYRLLWLSETSRWMWVSSPHQVHFMFCVVVKVTGYHQLCKLKAHNAIHFIVQWISIMVSTLQTFNVVDIQCCSCCGHSMLQTIDVSIRRWMLQTWACHIQNILYRQTKQPRAQSYIYVYSNDIHNVATKDLLTQQLSWYYFFSSSLRLWA